MEGSFENIIGNIAKGIVNDAPFVVFHQFFEPVYKILASNLQLSDSNSQSTETASRDAGHFSDLSYPFGRRGARRSGHVRRCSAG